MIKNRKKSYCEQIADRYQISDGDATFSGVPSECELCQQPIENCGFFADCLIPGTHQWGHICEDCVQGQQISFGYGKGQLYQKSGAADSLMWTLVAGFPERKSADE